MKLRLSTFIKAQLSAFIGGLSDYLIMLLLVEIGKLHYTLAIVISGSIGAAINFLLNRKWSFTSDGDVYKTSLTLQLLRFVPVVVGSIFLKSSGTYFFTNFFKVNYKISRLIVDSIVSWGYNYFLQKHWVFQKKNT